MHTSLRKISALVSAWFIICILLCTFRIYAQNNPYKIHDSLFTIYQRAYFNTDNGSCLLTADTLFRQAEKLHDTKAQCLALVINVIYNYNIKDQQNLLKAVNRLKAFSRKTGYTQYYYYATGNYINFLGNAGDMRKALDYANATYKEAEKENNHYGIYSSLRAISNIYFGRQEFNIAKQRYLETIKYGDTHLKNENSAMLYGRIALCCIELGQYAEAEKYATIGLEQSQIKSTRDFINLILCNAKFYTSSTEDFIKFYKSIRSDFTYRNIANRTLTTTLKLLYLIANKEFDTAKSELDRSERSPLLYATLYEYMGNYEKALEYREMSFKKNQEFRQRIQAQDIAAQEAQIVQFRLSENKKLSELRNTQLATINSSLELEQLQAKVRASYISTQHDSLEYRNSELENSRMRAIMERNRIANLKAEKDAHASSVRLQIIITSSILLLVIAIIIVIYRAKMGRKIKHLNESLTAQHSSLENARKQAEEADKMKTIFLQNMSHEVRTPLNAIVGFSQIIADDDGISEEERLDFAKRIEENSDIVQNIINSILDLTSIESGHYKMLMSSTNVIEMCNNAIAEVSGQIIPGVELKLDTDISADFCIVTDRRRVVEVLIALLSNAAKNTEHGHISLQCSVSEENNLIAFAVTDTGTGIPADKTDDIFDRFYKLDEFKQGVGLGLTICKAIAEKLNGRIYVDTGYNEGTRMVFEIPL